MKLSITSLYIISDAPKYDIIWIENSDMIDSFISEILKYKSSVIQSLTENPRPYYSHPISNHSCFTGLHHRRQVYAWRDVLQERADKSNNFRCEPEPSSNFLPDPTDSLVSIYHRSTVHFQTSSSHLNLVKLDRVFTFPS